MCSYSSSSSWCWTACSTPLVFILARWLSSSPAKCPALPCPAPLPCPFALPCLPCHVCPCPTLPCVALPCPALPCPALPCLSICPAPSCLSMPVPQCRHCQYRSIFCPAIPPFTQLPSTHTLTAWLCFEGLHCFAGSVAVDTDGVVLLLHLLPVLEPLQQQQCPQPAAHAHAHEDS